MDEEQQQTVRIFVGGLAESVTAQDLRRLFGSLGTVEAVETIRTKGRSFAYVDFLPSPTDEKSLPKLFSKYNGCLWKGGKLRLEKAKENYLARLKREWEEEVAAAELVGREPVTTNVGDDKLEQKSQTKESLKTKQLHIYFPRLKKVKSIPFTGTGKHKYSFQNIKVPPLPVHFCDCEEHCSPSGTERGKLYFDGATESGGINDEEINIMNVVMNKLFEKEKVSSKKHLEKEPDSFESPDALHSIESEADSATDEDDLIINMDTKKNKSALMASQELERILENQESWLNKTRVAEEKPNKYMLEMNKKHNSNSNKRKSLPTLEKESNGCVSATAGGKSNMQILPEKLDSGEELSESEDDFGESTKFSWSQKSSWKELLGDAGNTAFSASLILPNFDSGEGQQRSGSPSSGEEQRSGSLSSSEEQRSDSPSSPINNNFKTENAESDEYQGSKPTNTEVIKELTEAHPTNSQVIEEHVEAQFTDKIVAPNNTGRGTSWRKKQSWMQLVSADNNSFSISQILPGITFQEPTTKKPIPDPAKSNDCKHNRESKDPINEAVSHGFNLGEVIPENSQRAGVNDIASAPIVEKRFEMKPREGSSEETMAKGRSTSDVEIGETCTFMRSSASLKDWAKAKAAMRGSLKRKRGEK